MFGAIALTAVLLEVVGGYTPTQTGLVMIAQPVVMVALSPVAGHLSDTLGSRALASGGMLILAVGLTILATTPADLPLWRIVIGLAVSGLGMAAFSSPNTSAVMGAVEGRRLGVTAAVLAMMRTLGQTPLPGDPRHAGRRAPRRRRRGRAVRPDRGLDHVSRLPRRIPRGDGRRRGDRGGRRVPVAQPRPGDRDAPSRARVLETQSTAQVGGPARRPD